MLVRLTHCCVVLQYTCMHKTTLTIITALLLHTASAAQHRTATGTLTATAQVTAAPTPLMPTVIQHGMVSATRELPLGVTVHTQQISSSHIRVTITYP